MALSGSVHSGKQLARPCRRPGSLPAAQSRQSLRCSAILSGPRSAEQPQQASNPQVLPHRDSIVVKASDSASDAVPLPEPERQPPQIDVNWLNAVVDSTVKAPCIAYSSALNSRPLLTKACTSLVGFVLGDLIAQVRHSCHAWMPVPRACQRKHTAAQQLVTSSCVVGAAMPTSWCLWHVKTYSSFTRI